MVKKVNYDTKITEIEQKLTEHDHDKYVTTPETNNLAAAVFDTRLKRANLVIKTEFDDRLRSFNHRINTNKTKHLLVENELKKLKTFDLSYFKGKGHFEENGTHNYLVLQPMHQYFKLIPNKKYISERKSKGLPDESIKPPATSDNSLSPLIDYLGDKIRLKLNGSYLKQLKLAYPHQ